MLKRILLIDDESEIIEMIPMMDLSKERSYELCIHPESALERIVHGEFDIIVCDISMPKLDGISLARKVRSLNLQVPIVFFTGHLLEDVKFKVGDLENCSVFLKTDIKEISKYLSERLARAG